MRNGIDRRWWLIGMAIAIVALQWTYPTEHTSLWPPLGFVVVSVVLYRRELRSYEWGALRRISFWETVFFAVTQGIIAQAVGIAVVQYGMGIEPPALPFAVTPWLAVSAILWSAILEELVYRKAVFGFLDGRFGFWPAAAVSSALFAVAHANYAAYAGYFLLGLVWCRAYKKTGNIGVVIIAHMLFNAIAMFVMSGR